MFSPIGQTLPFKREFNTLKHHQFYSSLENLNKQSSILNELVYAVYFLSNDIASEKNTQYHRMYNCGVSSSKL